MDFNFVGVLPSHQDTYTFMDLLLFSITKTCNHTFFHPIFFWYLNKLSYLFPGGTGIISHILRKGKQADGSKVTCLEAQWIPWKMKNWYQKSFPSGLILHCAFFLSKYSQIKSSLILVLTTSTYVSSANSKPRQEKGQSIYSCDPHDLKLAGRLAKHSVMLKLFPEQQASLHSNQLKWCQTCQPIFSNTVLLRLSEW